MLPPRMYYEVAKMIPPNTATAKKIPRITKMLAEFFRMALKSLICVSASSLSLSSDNGFGRLLIMKNFSELAN